MGLSKESQEPAIKMAGHDHITQAGLDAVKLLVSSQNGSGSESVGIKHVGLSFEALSLSVPQTDVSTTKTLPRAILNTFGVDQFNFLLKCLRSSGVVSDTTETSNLLTNFTGLVKPGEMLLVLGQPGSGCSTFLRTAANQSTLTLSGDLRFANIPANEFRKLHRRETIYLPEEDRHIAALTVRQTIEFALRMSLPKRIRKPELIEEMVLTMSRMFGIEHTLGTPVGGPFFPGISGGERKRYVHLCK
jgi:ATP-binding cassette, subfamily G (WHITE), member 2, SNQ2